MQKHQISDNFEGLAEIVDYIKAQVPQLPSGFEDDSHKTSCISRTVTGLYWAKLLISKFTGQKYTLFQIIIELQKCLLHQNQVFRLRIPDIKYDQLVNDLRHVVYEKTKVQSGPIGHISEIGLHKRLITDLNLHSITIFVISHGLFLVRLGTETITGVGSNEVIHTC